MGREMTSLLTETRHFDLRDVGSQIRKHGRAEWARHDACKIKHPNTSEEMGRRTDHVVSSEILRIDLPVVSRALSAARAIGRSSNAKVSPICGRMAPAADRSNIFRAILASIGPSRA